ncbi:hypothetical protein [Mesobacterium pallidum]|nr:hypothetical protein [Mesobacterium pallidum]
MTVRFAIGAALLTALPLTASAQDAASRFPRTRPGHFRPSPSPTR